MMQFHSCLWPRYVNFCPTFYALLVLRPDDLPGSFTALILTNCSFDVLFFSISYQTERWRAPSWTLRWRVLVHGAYPRGDTSVSDTRRVSESLYSSECIYRLVTFELLYSLLFHLSRHFTRFRNAQISPVSRCSTPNHYVQPTSLHLHA